MAEGRALGVDATPTLYMNGRKLVGAMEWPIMQQLITLEVEHAAKCEEACVVTIPKIGGK